MRSYTFLYAAVIAFVLCACSDDSTSTDENTIGGGYDFSIVSVNRDTVYWGDTVIVRVRNAKTDAYSAFIHTSKCFIDSSWQDVSGDNMFRFYIPEHAVTGELRVYEQEKIRAIGNHTLVILPQFRQFLKTTMLGKYPLETYDGDLIIIHGIDIPLRRSDIAVRVGINYIPIVSHSATNIVARMIPGLPKGSNAWVEVFSNTLGAGPAYLLDHEGTFLEEGTLRSITMSATDLDATRSVATIVNNDTTTASEPLHTTGMDYSFSTLTGKVVGDSLIFTGNETDGYETKIVEVRLKRQSESRVSGVIRMTFIVGNQTQHYEVVAKDMRWIRRDTHYELRAYGPELPLQLLDLNRNVTTMSNVTNIDTLDYHGGGIDSRFMINLAF